MLTHADCEHLEMNSALGTSQSSMAKNMRTEPGANNYANARRSKRFEEAKSLLRKTMPVARRVRGRGVMKPRSG